jgi:hypothetical protein
MRNRRLLAVMTALPVLALSTSAMAAPHIKHFKYIKPKGQDCGMPMFAGGFGGPPPTGIPKGSKPSLDVFAVSHASCSLAKQVYNEVGKTGNPPAGWTCKQVSKAGENQCHKGNSVVAEGIIYKVAHKKHKK